VSKSATSTLYVCRVSAYNEHETGAAGIFRIQSAEPATECTSVSCDLASIASEPGTVTALVIAGVVAFVALAYIRDAEADCRNERRRVLDERDAFEEFADRVSGLDPRPSRRPRRRSTGRRPRFASSLRLTERTGSATMSGSGACSWRTGTR